MADPLIIQIRGDNSAWKRAIDLSIADTRRFDTEAEKSNQKKMAGAAKLGADIEKLIKQGTQFTKRELAEQEAAQKKYFENIAKTSQKARDDIVKADKKAFDSQIISLGSLQMAGIKFGDSIAAQARKVSDAKIKEDKRAFESQIISLGSLQVAGIKYADGLAAQARKTTDAQIKEAKKFADSQFVSLGTVQQAGFKHADRLVRDAKRTADAQAREAERAAKADVNRFTVAQYAADEFKGAIGSVVSQFTLLSAAQSIVGAIGDQFRQANQDILESTRFLEDYRKQFLELAALKGHPGDTTTETQESLAFRRQTLLGRDQARELQQSARNFAGTEIQTAANPNGVISEAEFGKGLVKIGGLNATVGGDSKAFGQLAGSLPGIMGKKGLTGDEMAGKTDQLRRILDKGGSDFDSGIKQLVEQSAYTKLGMFKDIADQGVVQAMFSKYKPEQAGENTEQFVRATMGSVGRMKGVKTDAADAMKVGQYLKSMNLSDQSKADEMGEAIAKDFEKQKAIHATKGTEFNPLTYLVTKGYGNEKDRLAIMEYANARQTGILPALEAERNQPLSTAAMDRDVASYQAYDPDAMRKKVELSEDEAKVAKGARFGFQAAAERQAIANMNARGETNETYERYAAGSTTLLQGKVSAEINRMYAPEYKRLGIAHDPENLGGFNDYLEGPEARAGHFRTMQANLMARGGELLPGTGVTGDKASEGLQELRRMRIAAEKANERRAAVPAALPAGPAPAMRRP